MNNDRDSDLEKLFARVNEMSPNESQITRWQKALAKEELRTSPWFASRLPVFARAVPWAATLALGMVLGFLSSRYTASPDMAKSTNTATVAYLFDKSE